MCILKTACKAKGFTLLEVMISVSIIALVFVSLFRMQSGTISLAGAGQFNTVAPILAAHLIARIEQDVKNWSQSAGDFGEHHPGITWTCDISDLSLEALDFIREENADSLKKIHIKITGPAEQTPFEVTTWRAAVE